MSAQLSDVVARLEGEKIAHKEKAKEAQEAETENEVLKARLTVAEAVVDATRARHSAAVTTWTTGQIYRYRDRGLRWEDFDTQVWAMKLWLAVFLACAGICNFALPFWWAVASALLWAILFWVCLFALPCVVLYSFYYDLQQLYASDGTGGVFRSYVTWEYKYVREFNHAHTDSRADNNALQAIKHNARYCEFQLSKGVLIFGLLSGRSETTDVIISVELFTQICNPKNLDPYLAPKEARSAMQRSAAHNHSVDIDRNLVIRGSYVYQETMCLAFFHYLLLRESWKYRDFLPTLPQ